MTKKTPHLKLNYYDTVTDASAVLVFDYIDNVSGGKDGQNLYIIDEFSGSITASMVKVTACVVTLGTPTGVISGSYNVVSVDTLGRITGGSIVSGAGGELYNRSGSYLEAGAVVVYEPKYDMAFNVSASNRGDGNPAVCGVLYEDIPSNSLGTIIKTGVAKVLVSASVYRGDWLVASASPGRATDALTTKRPAQGAVGIALTSSSIAYGTVMADLDVVPYTSSTGLLLLSGSASGSFAGNSTNSWAHTCTIGTNLLLVGIASNVAITSVMYNSQPMQQYTDAVGSPAYHLSVYYLENPPANQPYIIQASAATTGRMTLYSYNFIGTVSGAPIRSSASITQSAVTSLSVTPTSLDGDYIMDFARIGSAAWNPLGATQTEDAYTPYESIYTSHAPGAPATAMSWGGASASGVLLAIVIANS